MPVKFETTHYYDAKDEVGQFDYLLLSPDISKKNKTAQPIIERRGLQINPKSHNSIIKLPSIQNCKQDRY